MTGNAGEKKKGSISGCISCQVQKVCVLVEERGGGQERAKQKKKKKKGKGEEEEKETNKQHPSFQFLAFSTGDSSTFKMC